jgi:hypothetical protein
MACSPLLMASNASVADELDKVKQIVPDLQKASQQAALIKAVRSQNSKGMKLADIQQRDKEWMAASGLNDFMKSLMANNAAAELSKIEKSYGYIVESFLMDNKGANVAMTNKTSDYWQGDEAKFKKSFNNGAGDVHMGKVKFDKSAQEYLVQVSVPVMDKGKAIGAVTYGISLDNIK